MKVVFFVGTLQAGGLERFVTRVSLKAKQEKQFIPVVVCLTKQTGIFLHELQTANVEVYEAPKRWFRSPYRWWQLIRLIKKIKPDIIHSQVNFSMLQQFLVAWFGRARFTVTERNCYKRSGLALVRRRVQYRLLKIFGVVYSANSKRVASHLSVMFNEQVDTFPILHNGIDVPEVTPVINFVTPVRIGYVARMSLHKGHLFFLEVLEKLIHTRHLKCEAIFFGDGPDRMVIEKSIKEKKLEKFVTLTGVVPDLDKQLVTCDIVTLLSDFEGMPNVILEAMALGKPVVATDVGNARELLANDAGFILEKKNIDDAVAVFEQLIQQPELRLSMGQIGRTRIKNEFSLTSTLSSLLNYYRTIVNIE
ncbi:MAG: glycosyltransferase [Cyclobacteriaceae bacterium]|nr:MAG: glycosyltransferase [Cyclobacteriaceae bacterium]